MIKSPFADFNGMKNADSIRHKKVLALANKADVPVLEIEKIEKEKITKLVNDFNAKLAEDKDIRSLTSTAEKIQAALEEIEEHEEEDTALKRKIIGFIDNGNP